MYKQLIKTGSWPSLKQSVVKTVASYEDEGLGGISYMVRNWSLKLRRRMVRGPFPKSCTASDPPSHHHHRQIIVC
jgi:hypothetical protein